MRFISMVLGLAILLWVIYTYLGSNTVLKSDGDKTAKQQIDKAKEAANALQKSVHEQAELIQKAKE